MKNNSIKTIYLCNFYVTLVNQTNHLKLKIMRTFVKEITWATGMDTGWGNGYVVIPKGHPMHGKHYDEINVDIHGGLTFAHNTSDLEDWSEISENDKDGWVVGFDCGHAMDNLNNCPKKYVLTETENLKNQLEKL